VRASPTGRIGTGKIFCDPKSEFLVRKITLADFNA